MIAALAGGVGAARFLQGLVQVIDPSRVTIISNTGDDVDFFGLRICPDVDIVLYSLAGLVDNEKGWGLRDDTFSCQGQLAVYGEATWFQLGDRDLATHIERTYRLGQGWSLTRVTEHLRLALGVQSRLLPMTDGHVITKVLTPAGTLHFQEYLVQRRARDPVRSVIYEGADDAPPTPEVLAALHDAEAVIICPSNPIASIGPILALPGLREAVSRRRGKCAAISPIVGGKTLKGPADVMMRALGYESSALGVAQYYASLIDVLIVDSIDAPLRAKIESMGIRVVVTDTIMSTSEKQRALAQCVLEALPS